MQCYGDEEINFFAKFYHGKDFELDPINNKENLIAEWNMAKYELKNHRNESPEATWMQILR